MQLGFIHIHNIKTWRLLLQKYFMYVYIIIQLHAQNGELQAELRESKRIENLLLEQMDKGKQKLSELQENYDKLKMLSSSEEIESQLSIMQSKMRNVKSELGSIDVIKMHCTVQV